MALKKRQKKVLLALGELGGVATTRHIALAANLNVNGVSQTLGALERRGLCVECLYEGNSRERSWKLKDPS